MGQAEVAFNYGDFKEPLFKRAGEDSFSSFNYELWLLNFGEKVGKVTTLEIAFVAVLSVAAVISFLQNHWFIAMLIVALVGLVLWVLYSILCHVNYLIIPMLLRW